MYRTLPPLFFSALLGLAGWSSGQEVVPGSARPDFVGSKPGPVNFIDEHIFKKLQLRGINPAPRCSDAVFLRRAYLDLLGIVPDAELARLFVADADPEKRALLVDELLQRDEFADFWALHWADLLKIEPRQLGAEGLTAFHRWIRQSVAANQPLDQFARDLIAARGSTVEHPPANWWRAHRDPVSRAENTARVLLGTQLQCAQCHPHPAEHWTPDDYYDWAALFARLDYRPPARKGGEKQQRSGSSSDPVVEIKAPTSLLNAQTGQPASPRFLGGGKPEGGGERDELLALADWLPRSPMFARAQVNRVWLHLLGRGLVEPVKPVENVRGDHPAAQPEWSPELLDALARDFEAQGYDLRQLIRTIMASRTYQLAAEPKTKGAGDAANFFGGIVRRLTVEQMLDSISTALATPLPLEGQPAGTRLAQIPAGKVQYRRIVSEVERSSGEPGESPRPRASGCPRRDPPPAPPVFRLVRGPILQKLLTRRGTTIDRALAGGSDAEAVDLLFWSILTRPATAGEKQKFTALLGAGRDRRRVAEDLAWALFESEEFAFRP